MKTQIAYTKTTLKKDNEDVAKSQKKKQNRILKYKIKLNPNKDRKRTNEINRKQIAGS